MSEILLENCKDLMCMENHEEWYAIRTRSNFEFKVRDCLYLKSLTVLLPTTKVMSRRRDRRKIIDTPLFPGYLFARFDLDPYIQLEILKSRGVVCIVGNKNRPLPVDNQEISNLILVHHANANCSAYKYLTRGDRVIITDGPLKGLTGIYLESQKGNHIVISVELFQRSLSVAIDNYSYEKI